eukprot:356348-Chlamydomonas_euryale.AAC.7
MCPLNVCARALGTSARGPDQVARGLHKLGGGVPVERRTATLHGWHSLNGAREKLCDRATPCTIDTMSWQRGHSPVRSKTRTTVRHQARKTLGKLSP